MNVEKNTDCAYCGKPIDPERLEVLVTDRCTECARKYPEPRNYKVEIFMSTILMIVMVSLQFHELLFVWKEVG
jgi:predicted nucleic acid-binding Zn ribbon protein